MKRRLRSLIAIWQAEGVHLERHGRQIRVIGLDRPHWFDEWVERNLHHLVQILPDCDLPEAPPPRPILFENHPVNWNELGPPLTRDRPRRVLPGQARSELLVKLEEFARL